MMRRTAMKRGKKPLRRSGFSSPSSPAARESEDRPTLTPMRVIDRGWAPAQDLSRHTAPAIEKRVYVRSKKLLQAFRLIPCQHCGRADGTVCAAHSNWSVHGKGERIKADDNRCASLCAACHVPILDQGAHLTRRQRQDMWWRAHVRSVRLLLELGHWPEGVPLPDISINPWGTAE